MCNNEKAGSKFKLTLTKYSEPTAIKKQRLEQEIINLNKNKESLMSELAEKKLSEDDSNELKQELYKINNKITTLNTEIANFDNAAINNLNANTINTLNTSINNLDQILKGDGRFNEGLANEITKLMNFKVDLTKVFDKNVLKDIITEAVKKNQNISKHDVDKLYNMLDRNSNSIVNSTQIVQQLKEAFEKMSESTSDAILDEIRERLTDLRDINNYRELMLNTFGISDSSDDITKIRLIFLIINELDKVKGYRFATSYRDGINASLPLVISRVEDDIANLHELFNLGTYHRGDYISGKDIDIPQMMNNIRSVVDKTSVEDLNQMLTTLLNIDDIINKYKIKSKDSYIRKSDEPFDYVKVDKKSTQSLETKSAGINHDIPLKISPDENILYMLYRIEDILNKLLNKIDDKTTISTLTSGFDLDKYHELVKNNNDSIVDFKSCFK